MGEVVQGSEPWFAQRLGKLTASRMADATARTKTGWGASRANLMAELIAERLTGQRTACFTNAAMEWGAQTEAQARAAYEAHADVSVQAAGFVLHPLISEAGASPDGYVGDDGLLEIKCPATATHIDTLIGGCVPERHLKQMQFQMACTGRAWCDFVSYDPRLPADMQLFARRVDADAEAIAELEDQAAEFLAELQAKLEALTRAVRRAA